MNAELQTDSRTADATAVASSAWLGDDFMEYTCKSCGKTELPLNWPEDDTCRECSRKPHGLDLKACPFCGTHRTRLREDFGAYVICECGARGPNASGKTAKEIAITMWNTRFYPDKAAKSPNAEVRHGGPDGSK